MQFVAWLAPLLSPADLGSEDYPTRESASWRLRVAGPLAWPFLAPLTTSAEPETRRRAAELYRPAAAFLRDAQVAAWLADPLPPEPDTVSQLLDNPAACGLLADSCRRLNVLTDRQVRLLAYAEVVDVYEVHPDLPPCEVRTELDWWALRYIIDTARAAYRDTYGHR